MLVFLFLQESDYLEMGILEDPALLSVDIGSNIWEWTSITLSPVT